MNGARGFTLVEILAAVLILGLAMTFLFQGVTTHVASVSQSRQRALAMSARCRHG